MVGFHYPDNWRISAPQISFPVELPGLSYPAHRKVECSTSRLLARNRPSRGTRYLGWTFWAQPQSSIWSRAFTFNQTDLWLSGKEMMNFVTLYAPCQVVPEFCPFRWHRPNWCFLSDWVWSPRNLEVWPAPPCTCDERLDETIFKILSGLAASVIKYNSSPLERDSMGGRRHAHS